MSEYDPLSPDLRLFEHFYANESVADAAVGELNWEIVTIGNASTYANLVTTNTDKNSIGALRSTTNGTANGDGSVLRLDEDGLLAYLGTQMKWRVRYPDASGNLLDGNNWRIGLVDSVTATAPTVGIYIESISGVLTCHVASADHGDESVAVTGHPDLTSGTTMVLSAATGWTTFGFTASGRANAQGGPDEVIFHVNGIQIVVPSQLDDDEEMELSIAHWNAQGSAATYEFDRDYIGLFVPHPAGSGA
jgi:hypothetical protein